MANKSRLAFLWPKTVSFNKTGLFISIQIDTLAFNSYLDCLIKFFICVVLFDCKLHLEYQSANIQVLSTLVWTSLSCKVWWRHAYPRML